MALFLCFNEVITIKRPIVTVTLGAILGIISALYIEIGIIIFIFFILCMCIKNHVIKLYIKIFFKKNTIKIFLLFLLIFFLYTSMLNISYKNFNINEVHAEGTIIEIGNNGEYYNSYTIKGRTKNIKNKKFIIYVKKEQQLSYGDRVDIKGVFSKPQEQRNYKGFNYRKYLQTKKIYGTIKVDEINIIKKNNINIFLRISNNIRESIKKQVYKILPEKTGSLLIGIMIGYKNNIDTNIVNNFQKSSLAHILAISGTHVGYIVLGIKYLNIINKTPKKCGYVIIIFILIAFMFLTNFSISVIRACIMTILVICAKIFYRKTDTLNIIAISALISLVISPFNIENLSFVLSYFGTAGVIFISPCISNYLKNTYNKQSKKSINKLFNLISVPISAQILVSPIIIKNYNTISLNFLISNIIAIPLLGITIILGYIFTFFSYIWLCPISKISFILNIILQLLILISNVFSNSILSNIYVITPSNFTIISYYLIILFIFIIYKLTPHEKQRIIKIIKNSNFNKQFKLSIKKTSIILIIVILIVCEFPYEKYNGKLKIYFIDVGQRR